jgi:alpha-2-macroglobulin
MRNSLTLLFLTAVCSGVIGLAFSDDPPVTRAELQKTLNSGNYKDAFEGLKRLALDPQDDPRLVGEDLKLAVMALRHLGRVDEIDDFRESVIKVHTANWRLLAAAAESIFSTENHGFIVAGKFYRGNHRGGGKLVNSAERDRIRALQLMVQAKDLNQKDEQKDEVAKFLIDFAQMFMGNRGFIEAWRLQYLSDLAELPDYEDGWYYGRGATGAPVDAAGNPVFYQVPRSFDAAVSDGERWRWCLAEASGTSPGRLNETRKLRADFLLQQFGVQTMAHYGWFFARSAAADDTKKNESGTYDLHTLGEDETIAQLATGIKRFKLPDEFNYIRLYQQIADEPKTGLGAESLDQLARIFEDRRQYPRAAEVWRRVIKEYGPGANNYRQMALNQIVQNWGRFETTMTQPAGTGATIDFRFRNGRKVQFEAHAIRVEKLLEDVKNYLKERPNQLDWQRMNIADLGYRLVTQNQREYLGDKVAEWNLDLEPRADHFDKRITVTTPLQKAGAYLLSATLADGNVSEVVVWVSDTAIIKKPLVGKTFYYVADAASGQPIDHANVEFFGFQNKFLGGNNWQVQTLDFAEFTNEQGEVMPEHKQQPHDYQWLVTARTADGRFAFLGFTNVWNGQNYDFEYSQTKVYAITDRPVYRPRQKVKFKLWVRHAKYDQEDTSSFAGKDFSLEVQSPKGEKILTQGFKADDYGGFEGELNLPDEAALGVYQVYIPNMGGGTFRVEEYKKPEFEVTVEAPKEPIKLGEKVTAKIKAKYYFGAPVVKAKVKYKVQRTSYANQWYPPARWDWFYGPGYWWFAYNCDWYPGWANWGCLRPIAWWWRGTILQPPELVAEREIEIGADGTVSVEIDTALAKEIYPDQDQQYQLVAEVVDESRRTIVGSGSVLVARKPFKVTVWLDRGYYRTGDAILARFKAHTLDQKPVAGKGTLKLFSISYDKDNKPIEKMVDEWKVDTDAEGEARQQIKAAAAGQYRLSYSVTDKQQHTIEGAYLFTIVGPDFNGASYRFNNIELIPDKAEYEPGQKVKLQVNVNRENSLVLLFVRPANGIYLAPEVLRLDGKSTVREIEIAKKDMPNMFVEAVTIGGGKVYTEVKEIVIPPESRVIKLEVLPSAETYKPGQKAKVKIKLSDSAGKPFVGSTVTAIYDKAVEYISGGSNVPEIKAFFWKWRRSHSTHSETNLDRGSGNLTLPNQVAMFNLGVFGDTVAEELNVQKAPGGFGGRGIGKPMAGVAMAKGLRGVERQAASADGVDREQDAAKGVAQGGAQNGVALLDKSADVAGSGGEGGGEPPPDAEFTQPSVRSNFADTALWVGSLTTDAEGTAEVSLDMPENLTTWKIRCWAMGQGTKVGQGEAEVITRKDLLVRMQAPRFFVEKDEVVLTANVHNYLDKQKTVKVVLELDGQELKTMGQAARSVKVAAADEARIDWRVKVAAEGQALIRMKALTDEESDALEMKFPVYVHGMLKTESWSGALRPDKNSARISLQVPEQRRISQSRLELRYTPTLAGALVDALPYLVDFPYDSTDQTLCRFLPTVITQKILLDMKLDLKAIQEKRTNLNAQEIGDDAERAKGWKRYDRNPVFDQDEVRDLVKRGVQRLTQMQLADGGWGWFSGWGERSWPHTTAYVVHGLQLAAQNDVALVPGVLERGISWLTHYQDEQLQQLKNADGKIKPWKDNADELDAFVFMVLVDAGVKNDAMRDFIYRDRTKIAVYAKAMFGLALHKLGDKEKLDMLLQNISQYVVQDDENQTAYLKLPADNYWWYWYGSDIEADAYYLKLLARTDPKGEVASRLVKYLLNNRKHATYWNSTRDTAVAIEGLAEYLRASGEDKPDLTIEVWLDGQQRKQVKVDSDNLFTFDNKFVLEGDAVDAGVHQVEFRKQGRGPLYFNAYLTNFTLEDYITKAGLEIKVNRKYYKLVGVDKKIKAAGSRGQVVEQKVEKYVRQELPNLATLTSGDLVEIELEIDSKNDYEYLMFEDMKAAGFEAVELKSGYNNNSLGAYMELRDNRVTFFVRWLARGKHSVSYRMRAEIPGKFSALPTRASAVYAPELKANSDELKLTIVDVPTADAPKDKLKSAKR